MKLMSINVLIVSNVLLHIANSFQKKENVSMNVFTMILTNMNIMENAMRNVQKTKYVKIYQRKILQRK